VNVEIMLAGLATVALVAVLICTHLGRKPEPSLDEDINRPSLAVIDDALARTWDEGARDWLLDKRLAAMEREAS
jgi:hypothetical protein